ncbi:MAG: TetR/AcrR family transcriptional regulator [Candidatus Geothermincolia bacterium]
MPYETKQEKILRAAEEVFAEKGFRGATMKDIAEKVNIQTPGLYYHFHNKEEIYNELILDRYRELGTRVFKPVIATKGIEPKIRELVELLVDFWAEHPMVPRIVAQETMSGSDLIYKELVPNFLVPMFDEMVKALEEEDPEQSGLRAIDVQLLVFNIFGLTMFYFFAANIFSTLTGRKSYDAAEIARLKAEIIETVFKGIEKR